MSYHDDPLVNDAVLAIINDGNGEMCGMDYEARKAAAKRQEYGIHLYQKAAQAYIRYFNRHFLDAGESERRFTPNQLETIARLLQRYYLDHIAEVNTYRCGRLWNDAREELGQ